MTSPESGARQCRMMTSTITRSAMASRRRTRALSKANRVTDAPDAKNMKTLPTKALNELVIVTDNGGGL